MTPLQSLKASHFHCSCYGILTGDFHIFKMANAFLQKKMRSSVKHDAGTLDADGLMLIKGGAKRKKHKVDPKMEKLLEEDEEIEPGDV